MFQDMLLTNKIRYLEERGQLCSPCNRLVLGKARQIQTVYALTGCRASDDIHVSQQLFANLE